MARTTGPLLSMDASGSVGNSITFAKWKGRNYVRRYAIPANPRSTAQTSIRAAMQLYTALYKANESEVIAAFDAQAQSLKVSPFNAYTKAGLKAWKSSVLVFPDASEVAMGSTSASFSLLGTAEPRGITWQWSESVSGTPIAWILTVREAADPGVSTQHAIFGTAAATSFLQTGLKPATDYWAKIHVMLDTGAVVSYNSTTSVTTP